MQLFLVAGERHKSLGAGLQHARHLSVEADADHQIAGVADDKGGREGVHIGAGFDVAVENDPVVGGNDLAFGDQPFQAVDR